jgi:hypothetical protein
VNLEQVLAYHVAVLQACVKAVHMRLCAMTPLLTCARAPRRKNLGSWSAEWSLSVSTLGHGRA